MRCDPRVIKLEGVQLEGTDVEDGNHLRAFVGVEHGFFDDRLGVYRRPAGTKQSRLRSIKWPVRIPPSVVERVRTAGGSPVPIDVETTDPELKLSGSVGFNAATNVITIALTFPQPVGYLELQLFAHQATALAASDTTHGAGVLTHEGGKDGRLSLRNRAGTGMHTGRAAGALAWLIANSAGRLDIQGLRNRLEAIALYGGEFVARQKVNLDGRLSLVNVPLTEVHLIFPPGLGFQIEFLLMEDDCSAGAWEKVEEMPGPARLLEDARELGAGAAFQRLVRRRFWPDVQNRFTSAPHGWNAIGAGYGGPRFVELLAIVEGIYAGPGWVRMVERGPRVSGGDRARETLYVTRNYDPERVGFLNLLTQDVNIATLVGLHTVDRGQNPELAPRTLDPAELKQAGIKEWRQPFDYKVQGIWPHLGECAYVFYDVGARAARALTGPAITKTETLDGMNVRESETPARTFNVGLAWDIRQDVRGPTVIAYDVHRGSVHVTAEGPATPARNEETPRTMTLGGLQLVFHPSLPRIPPFTKPTEVKAASFQHVDSTAAYGSTAYAVEAVDVHGRRSATNLRRNHDTSPDVPIPLPVNILADVRPSGGGGFEIVTRWDWLYEQRRQAPDLARFDVFFHAGALRASLKGAVLWVEKDPEGADDSSFVVTGYAQISASAAQAEALDETGTTLILKSEGRKYRVRDVEIQAGSAAEVSTFSGAFKAKPRKGAASPSAVDQTTRCMLFIRQSEGVLKVPCLFETAPAADDLAGAGSPVGLLIDAAHRGRLAAGDLVLALVDKFLLAGEIGAIDSQSRSLDGSPVVRVEVQFDAGWAAYRLPTPTATCDWSREGGAEWIEWQQGSEVPVVRPSAYPLSTTAPINATLPIEIAASPPPRFVEVRDEADAVVPALNGAVLSMDGLATSSDRLLAFCRLSLTNFTVSIRSSLKGEKVRLVTAVPGDVLDEQLLGQRVAGRAATIARDSVTLTGTIIGRTPEPGETVLRVRLGNDPVTGGPPVQEWSQCAVRAGAVALPSDDFTAPAVVGTAFHYRILRWAPVPLQPGDPDEGRLFDFVVVNLVLHGNTQVDGISQNVDFEVMPPSGGNLEVRVPQLRVASFVIGGIPDEAFYREVDGGEISYPVYRTIGPHDPRYEEAPGAQDTDPVFAQVLAISITASDPQTMHVAFYPALDPLNGFLTPLSGTTSFFASFRLQSTPEFLTEDALRSGIPVHTSVRAVAYDGTNTFEGALAPVVTVDRSRATALLQPPAASGAIELPPGPDYAHPGRAGATYELAWQASSDPDATYRVYRISSEALEDLRSTTGGPNIHAVVGVYRIEDFDPEDPRGALTWTLDTSGAYPVLRDIRDGTAELSDGYRPVIVYRASSSGPDEYIFGTYPVRGAALSLRERDRTLLDDRVRIREALSLRNMTRLVDPQFTDRFDSRGGGRYYYRVVTVDKAGIESDWASSPLIPDPVLQGPLIVPDSTRPAAPQLAVPRVSGGAVVLEWQSDAAADAYWIYRSPGWPDGVAPRKLSVREPDDSSTSPRIEHVPIHARRESIPVQCRGEPPVLDLYWLPEHSRLVGLYLATDYERWRSGNDAAIPNLYPGQSGTLVHVYHRDGSEEDILLESPGSPLVAEYVLPDEVPLSGRFRVQNQQIRLFKSVDIAVLVGLYRRESFDPANPQNPLSGNLDLTGTYPIIRNVRDGATALPDGERPVILYKEADDPNEPVRILFGVFPVRGGRLHLVQARNLPVFDGRSPSGSYVPAPPYDDPALAIVAVFKKSDYEAAGDSAPNLYTDTFDGLTISGIALPDGEAVVIKALKLRIEHAPRLSYFAVEIEGFAQAVSIDSVTTVDDRTGALQQISGGSVTFDPTVPATITLPVAINAPTTVIIRYTDDSRTQRILSARANSSVVQVGRGTALPAGLAPFIRTLSGIWRVADYDPANPGDITRELVAKHGLFRRQGRFIQIHTDVGMPESSGGEPAALLIRFVGHDNTARVVSSRPGWLRFRDTAPPSNVPIQYRMEAVKRCGAQSIRSASSELRDVTVLDLAAPVPPDLTYAGLQDGRPLLSWAAQSGIRTYSLQRRQTGLPSWRSDASWSLTPVEGQTDLSVADQTAEAGLVYEYRLLVTGMNGKTNSEFKSLQVDFTH